MGFVRRYFRSDEMIIRIYHKVYKDFRVIGNLIEIRENLNIAKVQFIDKDGKEKKYWFHLFTGMVVTLPKKGEKYAKDVPLNSEKAYFLSNDPIHSYDLDPTLLQNYKPKNTKNTEDKDSESNPNKSINKIN